MLQTIKGISEGLEPVKTPPVAGKSSLKVCNNKNPSKTNKYQQQSL